MKDVRTIWARVSRETEKAYLLTCSVCWGEGGIKLKDIWFPKSVVEAVRGDVADVKTWFLDKQSKQNEFHGYLMTFEG
jgi:hypothetical protein